MFHPRVRKFCILISLPLISPSPIECGYVATDTQKHVPVRLFHVLVLLRLTNIFVSRLLFWFVSEELYNAQQLVADADEIITRAIERGMPSEDISAIQEAFTHLYASSTLTL